MKSKKIILLSTILIISSVILSACTSSVYASTSWHGLTISPATNPDTAYLAAGNQVYAIDLNTGQQKWKFPSSANRAGFYANPVMSEDGTQLIVPSYDHYLYSVNPIDGTQKWKSASLNNRLIASPLIIGDTIYQPSADGNVYTLNLANGQINESVLMSTGTDPIWAQPVTFSGCNCIYIASMNHKVYKFDPSTGNKLAESEDLNGSIVGTPAIGPDGVLYVGTFNNELVALNGSDLSVKWRFPTQDWVWAGPALDNGTLYFGDISGYFYAVNTADHTEVWPHIQPKNTIVDTPVISGDKIYLATESDTLFTISTSGEILNSTVVGGIIYTAPEIATDKILVAPTGYDNNLLIALNLENPNTAPKWTFVPAK
jgi:outer membrane protein assembly factor BamB